MYGSLKTNPSGFCALMIVMVGFVPEMTTVSPGKPITRLMRAREVSCGSVKNDHVAPLRRLEVVRNAVDDEVIPVLEGRQHRRAVDDVRCGDEKADEKREPSATSV